MLDLRSLSETLRHLLSLLAFSAPSTPPTFVVLLDSDIADTDLNVFAPGFAYFCSLKEKMSNVSSTGTWVALHTDLSSCLVLIVLFNGCYLEKMR